MRFRWLALAVGSVLALVPLSAADAASATTFGDGTFRVGVDIAAGTYESSVPADSSGCYWERESALDGSTDAILANDDLNPGSHAAVTIHPSDKGFMSQDCGTWSLHTAAGTTAPATTFGDGTYLVGTDIVAGTYAASVPSDSDGCYWERESALDGSADAILANDDLNPGAHAVVTIRSGDKGFKTQDCGTWRRT